MKTKVWNMLLTYLSYLHLYPYKIIYPHIHWKSDFLHPKINSLDFNPLTSFTPLISYPEKILLSSKDLPDSQFDATFLSLEDSDLESSILSIEPSFDRNNSPLALKAPPSLLDFIQPKI